MTNAILFRRGTAFATAAAALLALSACATMTADQCAGANWQAIGFEDGSRGAPSGVYAERAADCARAGAPANQLAYDAGRREGLRSYCTYDTGFAAGLRAAGYGGVCPVESADDFRWGYDDGLAERHRLASIPRIGVGIGVGSGGYSRVGVSIGTGIGIGF